MLGAFAAGWAQKRKQVLGVERVLAHGLLAGGVERDVHAAVDGPHDYVEVAFDFAAFVSAEFGIVVYQLFDLFERQVVFVAERSCFDVGLGTPWARRKFLVRSTRRSVSSLLYEAVPR